MSSGKLLINQKSRQQLDLFAKNPVGAIILNGQKGVGLGTIAKEFAREIAKNEVSLHLWVNLIQCHSTCDGKRVYFVPVNDCQQWKGRTV